MESKLKTGPKLLMLAVVVAGGYFGLRDAEQRMIYAPAKQHSRHPTDLGMQFQSIEIATGDGMRLRGWYIPAATNGTDRLAPTTLFFPAQSGNISSSLDKLLQLHESGMNVLTVDYRGYGPNTGIPSESGLLQDANALYFHAIDRPGVTEKNLYLYGERLGASVALQLASRVKAAGVILDTPFTSMLDTIDYIRSYIPWDYVLKDRYDNMAFIGSVGMPVLIIHKENDPQVPIRHSERLYSAAREPKTLIRLAEQTAEDQAAAHTQHKALVEFVRETRPTERAFTSRPTVATLFP